MQVHKYDIHENKCEPETRCEPRTADHHCVDDKRLLLAPLNRVVALTLVIDGHILRFIV